MSKKKLPLVPKGEAEKSEEAQKEEYIAQCMATDKTREECEELWKKIHEYEEKSKQPGDLLKTIEDQRRQIKSLESQVKQAAELVSGIQKERDASDAQEKQRLIYKLAKDSRGYLRPDHLSNLDLHDLRLISYTFKTENARDYMEYFERRRAQELASKRKSGMTVGEYDQTRKTWKDE